MRNTHLITGIMASLFFCLQQTSSQKTALPPTNIIPPTPQSQLFTKYVDYPVTLERGLPIIEIPLYEIEFNGLKIPINLSYHASGVKHGQYDGDIAVGWVLNPGYRINRTVYGQPDEDTHFPYNNQTLDYVHTLSSCYERDKILTSYFNPITINPICLPTPDDNNVDGEYDQFTYLMPEENGHFIMTDRTSGQEKFQMLEYSNYKIKMQRGTTNNSYRIAFKMNDDNGFAYYFGNAIDNVTCVEKGMSYSETGWPLMNIIASNNERINFNYTTEVQYPDKNTKKGSMTIYDANLDRLKAGYDSEFGTEYSLDALNASNSTAFIKSISTPKELISFERDTKILTQQVKSLTIRKSSDYGGGLLKTIRFYYTARLSHQELDSVVVAGSNEANKQVYRFQYYDGVANLDANPDQWGYSKYDPASCTLALHKEFENDKVISSNVMGIPNPISYALNQSCYQGPLTCFKDRNAQDTPSYYALQKIIYPTGGWRQFEYESNQFEKMAGPGLRMQKVTLFDGVKTIARSYKYGVNENGMGLCDNELTASCFANESLFLEFSTAPSIGNFYDFSSWYTPRTVRTYSADIVGDANIESDFSFYYPEIAVYDINTQDNSCNGKTIYNYLQEGHRSGLSCNGDYSNYWNYTNGRYGATVESYSPGTQPLLQEKQDFKYQNGNMQLTNQEKYFYSYKGGAGYITGTKVRQTTTTNYSDYKTPPSWFTPYSFISSFFSAFPYYINITGKPYLDSKVSTLYNDNGTVTLTENYGYNAWNQMASKSVVNSNNAGKQMKYKYLTDYLPNNATGSDMQWILAMQNLNMINPVIEEQQTTTNNSVETLSGGILNKYRIENGLPVLSLKYKLENTSSIAMTTSSLNANGDLVYSPFYKPDISFDKYDIRGHLLQYHKQDDVNTVYLWSYNYQYPVAKIEGLTYDEVNSAVGSGVINNLAANVSPTRDNIEQIRTSINAGGKSAQVTTYTYFPLIGMVTTTNPQGVTTNYTYDTFNRLYLARNDDKNVLARYRYGYQNAPDNGMGGYVALTATVTPGASSYTPGAPGSATLTLSGGSGNYSYNWSLQNSSGTVLQSCTSGSSFSYTCSQTGTLTVQCVVTDNLLGNTVTASTNVSCNSVSCSFTMQPGYSSMANNVSLAGSVATFNLVFYSSSAMQVKGNYLVATVCAACRPSVTRSISYSSNGRQWTIYIYPSGQVYFYLGSGTLVPVNSTVAATNVNYNL